MASTIFRMKYILEIGGTEFVGVVNMHNKCEPQLGQ
jgi:hypothetical protein